MSSDLEVVSVKVSREKGTSKEPVARVEIDAMGTRALQGGSLHAGQRGLLVPAVCEC